ncbi:hypothetical protein FQR65_LT05599 [Abscondita terminalis]|nr:hypothetical protein FQR65_LT05599 [Abscondita terminalis]
MSIETMNSTQQRLKFGIPLEEAFHTKFAIHPMLLNVFKQTYCSIINCGYPIGTVIRLQGTLNERLALKERISSCKDLTNVRCQPGTYLWVIRHYLGLLPVQILPKRIGNTKFMWWKIGRECEASLKSRKCSEMTYQVIKELLRLPVSNFLMLMSVVSFLRELSVLPKGEPTVNKKSVYVLVKYFSASIFTRPFRPSDTRYYSLLLYLIIKWPEIEIILTETPRYSFYLPLNNFHASVPSTQNLKRNLNQTNRTTQTLAKFQDLVLRVIPDWYESCEFVKDTSCQTEDFYEEKFQYKQKSNKQVSCCCAIKSKRKKNTDTNSSTSESSKEFSDNAEFLYDEYSRCNLIGEHYDNVKDFDPCVKISTQRKDETMKSSLLNPYNFSYDIQEAINTELKEKFATMNMKHSSLNKDDSLKIDDNSSFHSTRSIKDIPSDIEAKIDPSSDTLSEISETGTATSDWTSKWNSREDLRELIIKIGIQDVNDLYQDRFRVDRKKLEHMLVGDNEAPEPADTFFQKVMEDTNTFISWPSKLKIGAKSKKDPHVRIAGRIEDVQMAKDRIMHVLNTRCNRVTMKMDVSYTDHSHIIGKGGLSIKRVMEETRCHVHFPDSNRSNPMEKSNQVSIAGDIEGVERARSRVRNLTPLIFCFELPILGSSNNSPDCNTPYVLKVQQQYNVQVMFRTRPKLHATFVMVKGVEWEVKQVKQATTLLVEYMCDSLASQISIQMSIEISPNHHALVIGKNYSNLKAIIQNTSTQIMFPDAQDPNIPSLKKSNVTISGNIHNVYSARQQLMGSLPLVLMFDLPEDTTDLPIKPDQIAEIQSSLDVSINIRHKAKQNTLACVIKGIERYASNIYKARNKILDIREPCIEADIPATYFTPQNNNSSLDTSNTVNPPTISSRVSPPWQYSSSSSYNQTFAVQQPQFSYGVMHGSMASSGYHSLGQFSNSSLSLEHDSLVSISSASSLSSPRMSPRNATPNMRSPVNLDNGENIVKQPEQLPIPSDFEHKRLAGFRAMQMRPSGNVRVPTSTWSGYGISHTSPGPLELESHRDVKDDIWMSPPAKHSSPCNLNTSSFVDHTPTNVINTITNSVWSDLTSLLNSTGLEKYVGLFASHEIDLTTFPSLTDNDLLELGVRAFGPRRKMLLIITELNKRSNSFSAAPGAERRSSSSTSSLHSSPKSGW